MRHGGKQLAADAITILEVSDRVGSVQRTLASMATLPPAMTQ